MKVTGWARAISAQKNGGSWGPVRHAAITLSVITACSGPPPTRSIPPPQSKESPFSMLERWADQAPLAPSASSSSIEGPVLVLGLDAVWRTCAQARYWFEPVRGGPVAITAHEPSEVSQVIGAETLAKINAAPNRVRIHYTVAGLLRLEQEPSQHPQPAGCGPFRNYLRSVVVGAFTLEVERGVDLNEPQGSAQPSVRSAQIVAVGHPDDCAKPRGNTPASGCLVPLALMTRYPDGAATALLASSVAEGVREGKIWGPEIVHGASECYQGFSCSGDVDRDLQQLAGLCSQGTRLKPLTKVLRGQQEENEQPDHYPLRLESGECYRVFGTGSVGVADLRLGVVGAGARWLGQDQPPRPWAVLPNAGLLCPSVTGEYQLLVAVERGGGHYGVQVWQRER